MPAYRQLGSIPRKRHTEHRRERVADVEMSLETDGNVLGDGERRKQPGVLEGSPEPRARPPIWRPGRDVVPEKPNAAAVGA